MNQLRSNISKFTYYFFLVACVILILNLISSKSETAFKIIGFRTYTVLSGSMEPKFNPGDLVITAHKGRTKIEKDDVITFYDQAEKQIVTHRIVEEKDGGYVTKGDNNDVIDSNILSKENIIGEVVFHIPKVGYLIKFLSSTWVVAIELVLLGVLIIYYNRD